MLTGIIISESEKNHMLLSVTPGRKGSNSCMLSAEQYSLSGGFFWMGGGSALDITAIQSYQYL